MNAQITGVVVISIQFDMKINEYWCDLLNISFYEWYIIEDQSSLCFCLFDEAWSKLLSSLVDEQLREESRVFKNQIPILQKQSTKFNYGLNRTVLGKEREKIANKILPCTTVLVGNTVHFQNSNCRHSQICIHNTKSFQGFIIFAILWMFPSLFHWHHKNLISLSIKWKGVSK